MADIHNAIRYGTGETRGIPVITGMDASTGGLERVGETLQPVIDPYSRGEWSWPRQEHLWGKSITSVAVVGELSFMAVTCAPGSRSIVIVDGAACGGGATNAILCGNLRTVIAATGTLQPFSAPGRDHRLVADPGGFLQQVPAVEIWIGSDPALLDTAGSARYDKQDGVAANNTVQFVGGPWILKPGTGLIVQGTTVNVGLDITLFGHTRFAYPGELFGL